MLSAKAATQRSGFKVEVTTLKVGSSELTGEALFRVDRKGTPTVTVNADVSRLDVGDLRAAPAAAAAGQRPPSPAQPRLVPTLPFSASWLGRSAMSVTVRLGEIVGLGSKVQNASITLTSSETRFAFRAAATVGGGSAGFDLVYDPTGRIGQATLTAIGQPRVAGRSLVLARASISACAMRWPTSTCACAAAAAPRAMR